MFYAEVMMNEQKMNQLNLIIDECNLLEDHNKIASVLFNIITKDSENTQCHSSHGNHCNFSRSGGGHGNLCHMGEDDDIVDHFSA